MRSHGFVLFLALLFACGTGGPGLADGGNDSASADAGVDASADAGADASPDVVDASNDASDGGVLCDTKLRAATSFSVGAGVTATECWAVDIATSQKEHIVSIVPQMDKASVVRSLLVFHPSTTSAFTSTPSACTPLTVQAPLVYLWQPGVASSFDLPPAAGFPIEAGVGHFVVQITYENMGLATQTDSSGVDFCTTTTLRANDADVVAFGTTNMSLAPQTMSSRMCTATLDASFDAMNVFAALPHANTLATKIGLTQNATDVVPYGAYASTSQPWLSAAATFHTSDTVTTTCLYNNTTNSNVPLGWTGGETCFVFVAYYPKKAFANAWEQPLTLPGCP